MRPSQTGLLVGAILGVALILGGFGDMLIVALFAGAGWLVASVVAGDIDIEDLVRNRRGEDTRR